MARKSKEEENPDIIQTLAELRKEAKTLPGWDELQVISINKYGIEAVVKTTRGTMKMSMKELFTQYHFILKVFETFGISLSKVKDRIYEEWRSEWAKTITDMSSEYGTSLELLKESLETYTESAEDRDETYLKKGEPIILPDGYVAFKSTDFGAWLKRRYSIIYTDDQLRSALRDLECKPRQIGSTRIRSWTYKPKEPVEATLFNQESNDALDQFSTDALE